MMRILLVFGLTHGAAATPACAMAPNGKMLCCPPTDHECLANLKTAHGDPAIPPTNPTQQKMGLLGSLQTFANATLWDHTSEFDVAVIGVPFGLEPGYEAPGLQLLRRETTRMAPYSRSHESSLQELAVVDGQDLLVASMGEDRGRELQAAAKPFYQTGKPVLALGGDQSITVPLLRAAKETLGAFAMIHIDKDLAMGSGSREERLDKDTALFWAAAASLVDTRHSLHVGVRGNLPSKKVELVDRELGFESLSVEDVELLGIAAVVERIRTRLTRRDGTFMPVYLSVDLDVLDPLYIPGLGEEVVGGLTVSQLRALIAGLRPFCRVVGAELRGVAALSSPSSTVRVAAAVAHDLALLAGRQHLLGTSVVSPQLQGEL